MMPLKYHRVFIAVLVLLTIGVALQRDVKIENGYPVDLANRVIGARLQLADKDPYNYSWKEQDGPYFYNPRVYKTDSGRVSLITASPFFHSLLYPIVRLPQRQISRIWLAIEYLMLTSCLLFALSFATEVVQKYSVVALFALFLFTKGWMMHVAYGQLYIIVPALMFAFLFCLKKSNVVFFTFLAGLFMTTLIFIKPSLIIFSLPFLFIIKKMGTKKIGLLLLPLVCMIIFSILNKNERRFWQSYQNSIALHMKVHLGLMGKEKSAASEIQYQNWEGWSLDSVDKAHADFPVNLKVERFNIWVTLQNAFQQKISVQFIKSFLLGAIVVFLLLFYLGNRNNQNLSFPILAIFGFCIYTISEYLSPITRFEYYSVQCAFPCFLIAAFNSKKMMPIYILLLLGLLLNVFDVPFIKMRHTVGQMIILFAAFWLCFSSKSKQIA